MMKQPRHNGSTYGFSRAASLMQTRIRQASETRGFSVSRVLTHWAEIVGTETAQMARPVKVTYGRGGAGANLTLLTTGPHAPILEMQKEQIREKVNACYGYRAINRITLTQTAPTGFAEGQAQFEVKPKKLRPAATPEVKAKAREVGSNVGDDDLRRALEMLTENVLTKKNT